MPRFDYCFLNQVCVGFLKVFNPFNAPIEAQLLTSYENLQSELKQYDCFNQNNKEHGDEEFENIENDQSSYQNKKECIAKNTEEIPQIKTMNFNSQKFSFEPENAGIGLIDKVKSTFNLMLIKFILVLKFLIAIIII